MMFINIFIHKRRAAKPSCNIRDNSKKFFLPLEMILSSRSFWPCFFGSCLKLSHQSFVPTVPQMNFLITFRTLKSPESLTDIKPIILYHFGALIWWVACAVYYFVSQPQLLLVRSLRLDRYLPPNWSARVLCLQSFGGSYRSVASRWIARAVNCLLSQPQLLLARSFRLNRYLPPTNWFGYCVFSLLADHIDWWLPKSFAEK